MALTKDDLQAIDGLLDKRLNTLGEKLTVELGEVIQDGMLPQIDNIQRTLDIEFRKVNNRLDALDVWRADFRDLVRMLAAKSVLTAEEAASLHVHPERPAA